MAKWTSQKLAGAGGHRSVMLLKGRLVDSHLGALYTRCQDLSVSALISLRGEPILCLLQHLLDLKCCWVYSVSFSFGVWSEKFSIRNREGLSLRIPKGLWSVAGTLGTGDGRGWGGPSSPRYRLSTDYSRCTNTHMLNFCSPKDGHWLFILPQRGTCSHLIDGSTISYTDIGRTFMRKQAYFSNFWGV